MHKAALEALEVMHKLPPGWHMTKDPSSGRNYYYNPSTGATSWEAPPPPAEGQPSPATPKAGGGANTALLVSVDAWLSEIGHEALQPIFAENGIELLADLRALDESDLEIFGLDADTCSALWLELEKLPQADEMVIETSGGYMRSESADGLSPLGATGDAAPEQKRAALLADIAAGGGGRAGLRHVSFKVKKPNVDPHAAMLAGIRGGQTKLRSVPKPQGTTKAMPASDPALQGLAGSLASAIAGRRAAAGLDHEDSDSDGWDDD